MGSYFSYLNFWSSPETIEYPAHSDGKTMYWWETTVGKKEIKGWFRYHPDELVEFHKEDKHKCLVDTCQMTNSGHVTFMKIDFDRLVDNSVCHAKRDIIGEFKKN